MDLFVGRLPLPMFVLLLSHYSSDDFLGRESERLVLAALQKRKQQFPVEEIRQIERMIHTFQREEI